MDSDTFLLRIGTRGSRLAVAQAELVKTALALAPSAEGVTGYASELVVVKVAGDTVLDRPVHAIGGKGVFVKEITHALLDNRIDIAAHSLKDFEGGMGNTAAPIVGVLPAADPRDCLVVAPHCRSRWAGSPAGELPTALPEESLIVGTAAPRRAAIWRAHRPRDTYRLIRGNLDRRLRLLAAPTDNAYDVSFLAIAGLQRLGLWQTEIKGVGDDRHVQHRIRGVLQDGLAIDLLAFPIPPARMLPAPNQGIIGIQMREGDSRIAQITAGGSGFRDEDTWVRTRAERAVVEAVAADCHSPLGVWCEVGFGRITVEVARTDGSEVIRRSIVADSPSVLRQSPEELARALGDSLLQHLGAPLHAWCLGHSAA